MLRYLYQWFQGEILAIPGRLIAVVFLLLLFIVPLITSDPYILLIATFACIYTIYAASWDFLSGFAGQISLGHSGLFGLGAYGAALLNLHLGWSPGLAIPLAAFVAVAGGLIICIPALRLRGFYFVIVSLAFPLMLLGLVYIFPEFAGGELGLAGIASLSDSAVSNYCIILLTMLVSLLVMWKLTDSRSKIVRTGVIFHAIREDVITARCTGINVTTYKIAAFAISAFFAGIAGGFYAHTMRVAGPSALSLDMAIRPLIWTIFGGVTTIWGPAVGVFILFPLGEFLRIVPEVRLLLSSAIVIPIILFMPEGIGTCIRDKMETSCPRCKIINIRARQLCRVCGAPLHLERE